MILKLGMVCVGKQCRYTPHNMSNKRMHWAVKKKWTDAWKEEVAEQVMLNRNGEKLPYKNARVEIVLNTNRIMDFDGAYNSVKPILDALKKDYAGVIEDDSPKFIELDVKQNQVKHLKDQFVQITITKL